MWVIGTFLMHNYVLFIKGLKIGSIMVVRLLFIYYYTCFLLRNCYLRQDSKMFDLLKYWQQAAAQSTNAYFHKRKQAELPVIINCRTNVDGQLKTAES